jgi:hypothetical protein
MSSLLVFDSLQTGDTVSHVGIFFRPNFVNYCIASLAFSLVHLPPPSSLSQSQSTEFTDSVWLGDGGGGGVELCWRRYSAGGELTLYF